MNKSVKLLKFAQLNIYSKFFLRKSLKGMVPRWTMIRRTMKT